MAKMFILLIGVSLAFFGSSQSASFECKYKTADWGYLGDTYFCDVLNEVDITSLDVAVVDDVSGTHDPGFNYDNVEGFNVYDYGQIHYFPRGLNNFFKNLKGISIHGTGLKEIHQSDLKGFPKLVELYLISTQIQALEANLFDFNPDLEMIYLSYNEITKINPNVFDKLTKLRNLYLYTNPCINVGTDLKAVQDVIKAAKAQCTN